MKTAPLIFCLILFVGGCSKNNVETPTLKEQQADVSPAEAVNQPDPPPKKEFSTLAEAIDGIKPLMADTRDEINPGAVFLAFWAVDRLKLNELQSVPKTKYSLVMKDSDEQRGRLICTSGRIIEIASEKVEGKKLYSGGMYDDAGKIYRFLVVKSTGELVAQSYAKLCGVVIGRQSYQNSIGGVAHAIFLVGMFDLPENRK